MIIKDFTHSHIAGATALALSSYNEERSFASILSQINVVPNLYEFARNGFGVTAFDGDKCLAFYAAIHLLTLLFVQPMSEEYFHLWERMLR